jgi:hypothetical protein
MAENQQHVLQRAQAGNPLSDRGTGGPVASGLPPQLAEIPPELMKSRTVSTLVWGLGFRA